MNRIFGNPLKSAVVLILISSALAIIVSAVTGNSNSSSSELISQAEKKFSSLESEMLLSLDKISHRENQIPIKDFFLHNENALSGFSYYLLTGNRLQLWSDNEPAVNDSLLSTTKQGSVIKLSNGDFRSYKVQWGDTLLVGLILIRHNYDYQNKYLVNDFNPALGLGNFVITEKGEAFHLPNNQVYFLTYQQGVVEEPSTLFIVLSSIIAVLLLLSVFLLMRFIGPSTPGQIILVAAVFLMRTLMIYFKWPLALYDQSIFDPSFYASSFYFNSLGDMLINSALILVLAISIFEHARPYKRMKLVLLFYWLLAAFAVHYLIHGLVINSRLNFELSSPADINIYSFLAYTSISLLLISFLFVTGSVWRNLRSYFINGRHAWIGITVCALYTAVTLSQLNISKEHETRKLLAQKAEVRRDHVAEYLFREQEDKIARDTTVKSLLHSGNVGKDLSGYILPKYLSGYLSKFEISIQIIEEPFPGDTNINLNYYRELAATGKQTESKNLYFINNESGGATYLALVPILGSEHPHTMVVTMTPRLFRTTKGFPELLLSGTYREVSPADDYSIARYSSKSLIYQYGEYVYPLTGNDFVSRVNDEYREIGGYSHLVHYISNDSFIVVSRPASSLLGILTLFSWMFIFMSVAAFVIFILAGFLTGTSAWQWNLTRKVQTSVIFLVVLIFTLVGTGTVFYIKSKYLKDQNKSISDQVNALWFLVNDNVSMNSIGTITDDQTDQLNRLVSNTNIDFNLYDKEGHIVYSSQPKIFNVGIVSDRMNTKAYLKIYEEGLTQFIHPEKTGQLRYIAAYAPFTDRSGKISAFLNLPYFEKQNELNKEVSVFLSAIVNIYVLLFALAVFVTIFISSRITKPLLLIQAKMSGIKLGSMNEKIEYRQNDEIGQLVHEYNRMIDELADSAAKLSRSERESAWREMARQVAHEIKNPLTPMKLSVQHLHRTLKDGTDKAMVDRITETLINQIDALSNIATAFSNFAKMPQAAPSHINLKEVVKQVIDLYDDAGNIHLDAVENAYAVHADRDQLVGVFSNLLKNSLQSVPGDRKPEIHIRFRREAGCVVVEIADNGVGIPEDQKDKIFIPNFTTKSSGMGLGLAIARNIIEEANGKIWFTSTYGSGSSFFVSLPEEKGQF